MLSAILEKQGMSAKEAALYLACLESGTIWLTALGRKVGDNRVTVYSALQPMIKKGWISSVKKKNALYFSAASIDTLFNDAEKNYKLFKEHLPLFSAVASDAIVKPEIQFFQGVSWLKQIYAHVLASGTSKILSFRGIDTFDPELQKYVDKTFIPGRVKKKIPIQVITGKIGKHEKYIATDKKLLRETVQVETKSLPFALKGDILIYGDNKVAIAIQEEMIGIVVSSTILHDNMKGLFDMLRYVFSQKKKK